MQQQPQSTTGAVPVPGAPGAPGAPGGPPVRRNKRGRPPGSKNKTTIAREMQQQARAQANAQGLGVQALLPGIQATQPQTVNPYNMPVEAQMYGFGTMPNNNGAQQQPPYGSNPYVVTVRPGEDVFDASGSWHPHVMDESRSQFVDYDDGGVVRGYVKGRWLGRKIGRSDVPINERIRDAGLTPLDEAGNELEVEADEAVGVLNDALGDEKVDDNGVLMGDRQYRAKVFVLPAESVPEEAQAEQETAQVVKGEPDAMEVDGADQSTKIDESASGNKLFMLVSEIAPALGFDPPHTMFEKHPVLYKKILSPGQVRVLVDRGVLDKSAITRIVGVIAARSVFREFGGKAVIGGKSVIDDYYETQLRESGALEGQPLDVEPATRLVYTPLPLDPHAVYSEPPLVPARKVIITDENWMLQHARAARHYNHSITQKRLMTWTPNGVYEPHTGQTMYPQLSQPSRARWSRQGPAKGVVLDTVVRVSTAALCTGLKDVDEKVYKDVVSEDVLKAIERQKAREVIY